MSSRSSSSSARSLPFPVLLPGYSPLLEKPFFLSNFLLTDMLFLPSATFSRYLAALVPCLPQEAREPCSSWTPRFRVDHLHPFLGSCLFPSARLTLSHSHMLTFDPFPSVPSHSTTVESEESPTPTSSSGSSRFILPFLPCVSRSFADNSAFSSLPLVQNGDGFRRTRSAPRRNVGV